MIPAVDVLQGQVVRLRRGNYDDVTTYGTNPIEAAQRWTDQGAGLVHVVDLDGARGGIGNPDLWSDMAAAGVPFQVGGGLREEETVRVALETGAVRVVLGTTAVWNPDLLSKLVERFGVESIGASVDVRAGRAAGAGWEEDGRSTTDVLAGIRQAGVEWVFVTAIGRDGTLAGPDVDLIEATVGKLGERRVVAAGGVGSLNDLAAVRRAGAFGVIVGRALYENVFTLSEAFEFLRQA